jgi:glycine dehydrogenase
MEQDKYWPAVARVDNVYGDRNLFCSCVPVEGFESADACAVPA